MSRSFFGTHDDTRNLSFASRVRRAISICFGGRRSTQKCSYCHSTQHPRVGCEDYRRLYFVNYDIIEYRNELRVFNRLDSMFYFNLFLEDYCTPIILKAHAIHYCNANSTNSLTECIRIITEKMFSDDDDNGVTEDYLRFPPAFQLPTAEEMSFMDEGTRLRFHALVESSINARRRRQREERHREEIADLNRRATKGMFRKYDIKPSLKRKNNAENQECAICYEELASTQFVKLNCTHEFCIDCLQTVLQSCSLFRQPSCAICRTTMSSFEFQERKTLDKLQNNLCDTNTVPGLCVGSETNLII